MFNPKTAYAKIAFETILFYKTTGQIRKMDEEKISADLKLNLSCVISIVDLQDNLLASFGKVNPENKTLYEEIVANTIHLLDDKKNKKITKENLSEIKVYVDILSEPQKVTDLKEVKPSKHGIVVQNEKGKQGFTVPDIKKPKSIEQQIEIAKKQGGLKEKNILELELFSFHITRYD
ncbi:MAG: hypothetical protein A2041_05040 [Bacteroidetes bacterium GWA2_31_9b]|nr:MAG: hypothetical protein A2041_05040 [Bacteroidetes bacterium GWA2_31_9b]